MEKLGHETVASILTDPHRAGRRMESDPPDRAAGAVSLENEVHRLSSEDFRSLEGAQGDRSTNREEVVNSNEVFRSEPQDSPPMTKQEVMNSIARAIVFLAPCDIEAAEALAAAHQKQRDEATAQTNKLLATTKGRIKGCEEDLDGPRPALVPHRDPAREEGEPAER